MDLNADTSLDALLKAHPYLADFLAAFNPRFKLLSNRVMRATVGKMATLKQVAAIGEITVEDLAAALAAEIARRGDAGAPPAGDDRIIQLKELIRDLNSGAPYDEVKARFDAFIANVEPLEIVAMEQQLIAEGMPVSDLQRMSDLHVGVLKGALDCLDPVAAPPGHPAHTIVQENMAIEGAAGALVRLLGQLKSAGDLARLQGPLRQALAVLGGLELHYQRKENQIFPYLEEHGITGPPQVMWGRHDEVRAQLKQARQAVEALDLAAVSEVMATLAQSVVDMVYKEDHILLPLALETLSRAEWIAIKAGEAEIGYPFGGPAAEWPPAEERLASEADATLAPAAGDIPLDTGLLTLRQLNLMLKHLPVDLTFVDEQDRVRYYSAGAERIFPRSPGIIGRSVQNCHPPKSLDVVNRIVAAFKDGSKDEASFWIWLGGKLVYIRYLAVRDEAGVYIGTVEVSQDVTAIHTLKGERRLLDWEG